MISIAADVARPRVGAVHTVSAVLVVGFHHEVGHEDVCLLSDDMRAAVIQQGWGDDDLVKATPEVLMLVRADILHLQETEH